MPRAKTLTLLRHAKSSWDNPELPDHDRPLNARGERDAPEMGRRLRERGIRPSGLVTSSAMRTRHTARHVAQSLGFPIEFIQVEKALYHARPEQILKVLAEQDPQFHHLLLVGHNPGISELAERLSDGLVTNMPTAAMLTVSAELTAWDELRFVATSVVGYDFPKNANGVITH
ncbi:MAG: histidine phosphatase family protein [Pseudomonadota bacterium]